MASKMRVAIVGGGIAGLTLAGALQLLGRDVVFDVFESKSSFSERGASVGLAPNAISILRATGFDLDAMLRETGAARSESTEAIAAVGQHRGERLWVLGMGVSAFSVVRTAWLDELLSGIPEDRLHTNKILASIDCENGIDGPCKLTFQDGSTFEADVVVGCDGIHSKVREITLDGEDNKPVFAGYWDARTILDLDKAVEGLKSSLFDSASLRQRMLIGDGSYMLLIPHEDSKKYFVVAAGASDTTGPEFSETTWKADLTREFLEKAFKDWEDPLRSTVIDSLLSKDTGPGYLFSEWESAPTSTFCRDRLCIIGDAAHSILPWIGQGAALSTEDACVLAALLGVADNSASDITLALQVFNRVSRERAALALDSSRNAAKLSVGGFGIDAASVGAQGDVANWWLDLGKLDGKTHIGRAVGEFKALKTTHGKSV